MNIKAIIVPGNGGPNPQDNWFPYIESKLKKLGIAVINTQFPDPILARQEFWLPFIKKLSADKNTILIGHSSGAIATLRFAEKNMILGSILVGAYYTDLGDENEKKSNYFNTPWDWQSIKSNQKWIVQFASIDDPYIPIEEARYIHNKLNTEYYEYTDQGHFGNEKNRIEFPEIIEIIKNKLNL